MRNDGRACHDPGGAVTAGAGGVHCPGGAAKDAEGIELSARVELLERARPITLGAAAFFAAAEVAVDIAVAASGPQKN